MRTGRRCEAPGCDRGVRAIRWCWEHAYLSQCAPVGLCFAPGCIDTAMPGTHYCELHAAAHYLPPCSRPGCEEKVIKLRGHPRLRLCRAHLDAWIDAHYSEVYHQRKPRPPRPLCVEDGCTRPARARGYCTMHYSRLRRAGRIGSKADTAPHEESSVDTIEETR